ncbi:MAG: redoxin family protein [Gemmataceae bacterium]|nr:redoxin family protein [Gemmataceae bacterium]
MYRLLLPAALAALLAVAGPAPAGKFNKVLSPGDAAPAWDGLAGTDGKKHALSDLKGKDVVVVVFTCNSCPVAEAYEDRIVAFAKRHAGPDGKVGLVAVNVNTGRDDALPAMVKRAEKKGFPFPYLYDPSQEVARKYGANYTPEFVVLDKDRKVVYLGAMDDKAPPGEAKLKHLEAAVAAALAGTKPETAETSAAAGCGIKFDKKKRDSDD